MHQSRKSKTSMEYKMIMNPVASMEITFMLSIFFVYWQADGKGRS
jgi:hypothetical protein